MPLEKALSEYMVVLFHQYTENIYFLSNFSVGGLHDWGILLVISLEFQEVKHQPFSMTQPWNHDRPFKGRFDLAL